MRLGFDTMPHVLGHNALQHGHVLALRLRRPGWPCFLIKNECAIIRPSYRDHRVTLLRVARNTRMALSAACNGCIVVQGKVVLDGEAVDPSEKEDARDFHLGDRCAGRRSFRNPKSCKRRARPL